MSSNDSTPSNLVKLVTSKIIQQLQNDNLKNILTEIFTTEVDKLFKDKTEQIQSLLKKVAELEKTNLVLKETNEQLIKENESQSQSGKISPSRQSQSAKFTNPSSNETNKNNTADPSVNQSQLSFKSLKSQIEKSTNKSLLASMSCHNSETLASNSSALTKSVTKTVPQSPQKDGNLIQSHVKIKTKPSAATATATAALAEPSNSISLNQANKLSGDESILSSSDNELQIVEPESESETGNNLTRGGDRDGESETGKVVEFSLPKQIDTLEETHQSNAIDSIQEREPETDPSRQSSYQHHIDEETVVHKVFDIEDSKCSSSENFNMNKIIKPQLSITSTTTSKQLPKLKNKVVKKPETAPVHSSIDRPDFAINLEKSKASKRHQKSDEEKEKELDKSQNCNDAIRNSLNKISQRKRKMANPSDSTLPKKISIDKTSFFIEELHQYIPLLEKTVQDFDLEFINSEDISRIKGFEVIDPSSHKLNSMQMHANKSLSLPKSAKNSNLQPNNYNTNKLQSGNVTPASVSSNHSSKKSRSLNASGDSKTQKSGDKDKNGNDLGNANANILKNILAQGLRVSVAKLAFIN